MQPFLEVWRIFAEFGYFWSEFDDRFLFLSGNPGVYQSTWKCRWKSRHKFRTTFHTQPGWPYRHVIFPVFSFVISGFCLLFGLMLFLAESLSSLWKYYFLVRMHCSVYIINSLLSADCICSWAPYLFDCKPRLIKFLSSFHAACNQGRLTFFTLSKGIDDAQSFLGYVSSNKFFFRIRFSSATRAHPSQ